MSETRIVPVGEDKYEIQIWSGSRLVKIGVYLGDGYVSLSPGSSKVFVDSEESGGTVIFSSAVSHEAFMRHILSETDRTYPDPNPSITQSQLWRELYPEANSVR